MGTSKIHDIHIKVIIPQDIPEELAMEVREQVGNDDMVRKTIIALEQYLKRILYDKHVKGRVLVSRG